MRPSFLTVISECGSVLNVEYTHARGIRVKMSVVFLKPPIVFFMWRESVKERKDFAESLQVCVVHVII